MSASASVAPIAGGSPATVIAACGSTCNLQIAAPVGSDKITVTLFAGQNGMGDVLSQGSTTFDVIANTTNTIPITFDGIAASVALSIDAQPIVHTAGTSHLLVDVLDASGNIIVAPGVYPTVALSNDDTTGTIGLGATQVTAPNTLVAVNYNGNGITTGNASANITATINGTSITSTFPISPQPIVTVYPGATNSSPQNASMTVGPDGALWFTELPGEADRISTSGSLSRFTLPNDIGAFEITNGPNGALWLSLEGGSGGSVAQLTTSGTLTPCASAQSLQPPNILTGPDNNIWFAGYSTPATIGQVTTSCVETDFSVPDGEIARLTVGPDNAFWFTQGGGSGTAWIGRMTTTGIVSEYPLTDPFAEPNGIAKGPDGYLWFVNGFDGIGHVSTNGTITEFANQHGISPEGDILVGPDGAMWFDTNDGIGRTSLSGQMVDYPLGTENTRMSIFSPVLGPDHAIWGIDFSSGNIVRVSI